MPRNIQLQNNKYRRKQPRERKSRTQQLSKEATSKEAFSNNNVLKGAHWRGTILKLCGGGSFKSAHKKLPSLLQTRPGAVSLSLRESRFGFADSAQKQATKRPSPSKKSKLSSTFLDDTYRSDRCSTFKQTGNLGNEMIHVLLLFLSVRCCRPCSPIAWGTVMRHHGGTTSAWAWATWTAMETPRRPNV